MNSTSVNLLQRLKSSEAGDAWTRFVELYAPLIFHWARQHGMQARCCEADPWPKEVEVAE